MEKKDSRSQEGSGIQSFGDDTVMSSSHVVPQQSNMHQQQQQQQHPLSIRQHQSIYDMIMSKRELTSNQYSHTVALHRPVGTIQTTTVSNINDNQCSLDQLTKRSLPYFLPWHMTASPTGQVPPDFSYLANSCGGKAAIGVFGGGVMGLLMGVFLGAMSDATPPVQFIAGKEVPTQPLRDQMKLTLRATANKSLYWCKNFAFITGVFGGSECLVEKYRGKHDVWNSVLSGCLTGAALQAKSGPQAAAVGCGGFAAFSLVIDSVMGHY
jgi:mitochondrial import inner membrane translocase subunit TIM22